MVCVFNYLSECAQRLISYKDKLNGNIWAYGWSGAKSELGSHESLPVSLVIGYFIDLGCIWIPCWLIKILALNWPSRFLRAIPERWYSWVINPWKREGRQEGDITQNKFCRTRNNQVCLICNHNTAGVTSIFI